LIHRGSLYTLSFLAKGQVGAQISAIYLVNGDNKKAQFTTTSLSNEWVYYKVNLSEEIEHIISSDEKLVIKANSGFYIDNIKLTEILDRYYLIKDSWSTPDVCNQDPAGDPYPLYDLGCEKYSDRSGTAHYLRSFSQLCADSAVGCELMIDTHNYSDPDSVTVKGVTVPANSFAFIVYDQDKQCLKEDKGCQRLGDPYQYESEVIYGDVYLKNNPDKYNEILCLDSEVGCEEWSTSEGAYYFRDPGDMACQWRQEYQGSYDWFKKKIKRCDTNSDGYGEGGICRSDGDCSGSQACLEELGDNPCPTSPWLTFGYGGSAGAVVNQPTADASGYWAGLCPASQAGCSEYIDPISKFNADIIFNADFSQDVDNNGPDGWNANSQEIALKNYSLYRLAGSGNVGSVSLDCPDILYILNENNILTSASFIGALNIYRASLTVDSGEKGILVYSGVNTNGCRVRVGQPSGRVELKKAVIDYQIKSGLDKQSCNGLVNFEKGCVLFNERTQNGSSLSGLKWDADLTINDQDGVAPQAGVSSGRDSNALIKVTPDRVCQEWLACRSFIKDESDNNVCFDIGLCDAFDDNGNCNNFVISPEQNQLYSTAAIGKYSNATGYSKVGYNSGGALINDYYPFGAMEQDGEVAKVPNGNFEFAGSNGYPIGWTWEGAGGNGCASAGGAWNENVFKVINNPIGAQAEGVGQAPEGRSFLKLGSIYSATSEFIDVIDSIEYIITANVNTINLSEGTAKVKISQYNSIGNLVVENDSVMSLAAGNNWNFEVGKFNTNPIATRVKVTLHSQAGTTGNFYFDDVRIRPALISREQGVNNWYTVQDCRLYPEDDALSCDYFEDSGDRQKGWPGYCLEYDRYPGSPDACLLWYPVDKVKGDGIEEGAGYNGKIPVYYCLEASGLQALEYRETGISGTVTEEWWDGWACDVIGCPWGWGVGCLCTQGYNSCMAGNTSYFSPVGTCIYDCNSTCGSISGWYIYDGFHENEASHGVKYYNPNTGEIFDDIFAYCTKVAQTVDSVGGNKYWSGRVYEGSSYTTPVLARGYEAIDPPFGSIIEPYPINNPYEWDGSSADGNQPIYVNNEGGASADSPYKISNITIGTVGQCSYSGRFCLTVGGAGYDTNKADCAPGEGTCTSVSFPANPSESIKRLFTQSYGHWTWDTTTSRYTKTCGQDWGPPIGLCVAGTRPDYPNDYCAISPTVNSVKVNSQTVNVALNKNGFVNLTFNSKVDSQQQPLVMYAVDWGDDEKMVVTGVEMRDRANEKNPHSLYHLYSYWDLKAKDAGGAADVNCDADCSISATVNDSCCWVRPKVKIKDNWGWCNGGGSVHDCDQWQNYGGWIVVTEK
ncbi:hypothetical protein COV49_03320, partial [Candidatus Falkowbacteria bacterium CG11_big_fil_rev_8_21_14_0_20_39_10]